MPIVSLSNRVHLFRVASTGSVLDHDRTHFTAGAPLDKAKLTEDTLKAHIKSGFVVPKNAGRTDEPPRSEDKMPPLVAHNQDDTSSKPVTKDGGTGESKVLVKEIAQNQVHQRQTVWTLDPSTLKNLTLPELNVMIGERDPNIKPFETQEEAIAQLSAEFRADSQTATS